MDTPKDSPKPVPSPDNARALYEYGLFTFQEYRGSRDEAREHSHKIILILLAAIAGLGGGCTLLLTTPRVPMALWVIACIFALAAFVVIGCALWNATKLFQFDESPVPGSATLDAALIHNGFHTRPHPDLLRDLARNLFDANQKFVGKNKLMQKQAKRVNCLMLASVLLTMVFLGLATGAQLWATMPSNKRSVAMTNEPNEQQEDIKVASENQSDPPPELPPIVQETDWTTRGGDALDIVKK